MPIERDELLKECHENDTGLVTQTKNGLGSYS